jgi:hypothetical protein
MHLRRTTALSAASLLLAVPMLTSCGFNYASDQPNTLTEGTNNRDGSVDVLNAVIVSGQDDSGTFIASLANNDQEREVAVESLAGAGGSTLQVEQFSPMTITPGGALNLAQEGGIPVSGTFGAGDFLPVSIALDNGERVTLDVPVVEDTEQYEGLDTSSGSPSESASPSESSPSESASAESSESPTETPSSSPSE